MLLIGGGLTHPHLQQEEPNCQADGSADLDGVA
jgi:hypothetical protein